MRLRRAHAEFLDLLRVAHVATADPRGVPHVVPVCLIVDKGRLYFASGKRALPSKTSSRYLQQAYSIALKNGRVKSQLQYLLPTLPNGSGSTFNTGIVKQDGKRLPQYNALKRWYQANRGKVKRPGRALTLPEAPANPTR